MGAAAQPDPAARPAADSWNLDAHEVSRRSLRLLLSLVLLILIHPLMSEGAWRAHVLGLLTFVPLVIVALSMRRKRLLRITILVSIGMGLLFAVAAIISGNAIMLAAQWTVLTVAFGGIAGGLFLYLLKASQINRGHLTIAASIYLLMAVSFYCIYSAVAAINGLAFMQTAVGPTHAPADLLYFSLTTLTTLGYGDIVPVAGFVRMLAALEAATGVLYVAITVATLVSKYKGEE